MGENDEDVLAELLLLSSSLTPRLGRRDRERRVGDFGILKGRACVSGSGPERREGGEGRGSSSQGNARSCRGYHEARATELAQTWPCERGRSFRRRTCDTNRQLILSLRHRTTTYSSSNPPNPLSPDPTAASISPKSGALGSSKLDLISWERPLASLKKTSVSLRTCLASSNSSALFSKLS